VKRQTPTRGVYPELNQAIINISIISNGIYFIKINNTNGFTKDIKFVVAR